MYKPAVGVKHFSLVGSRQLGEPRALFPAPEESNQPSFQLLGVANLHSQTITTPNPRPQRRTFLLSRGYSRKFLGQYSRRDIGMCPSCSCDSAKNTVHHHNRPLFGSTMSVDQQIASVDAKPESEP
jgi:hypothetical protein